MDHADFRDRVEWLAQSLMSLKIIRGPRNLSEPWISNAKNRFQPWCVLCAPHVGADRNQTPGNGQISLHSWGSSVSIPFAVRHRTLPEFCRAGHGCGRAVNVHVYRQCQKNFGQKWAIGIDGRRTTAPLECNLSECGLSQHRKRVKTIFKRLHCDWRPASKNWVNDVGTMF